MAESRRENGHNQVPLYAKISLGAFLCSLIVLLLLIVNAQKLSGLGLTEQVYYLVLVLMGLTAAVFLFGVLPSSATYKGKHLGGSLKLSGAVVGAALVVVGGYLFVPKGLTFPFTVYVHGQGGPSDIALRNSGHVVLKLGPELKSESIGDNGQAYFPAIPSNFRGQEVPGWVESDEYEVADASKLRGLEGVALDLTVQRKRRHYRLAGTVFDPAGNPLPGVRVSLTEYNLEAKTDGGGGFAFEVVDSNQRMVTLVAQKSGFNTAHLSPTLGDSGLNFSLQRSP
jgi:hypothetical protein